MNYMKSFSLTKKFWIVVSAVSLMAIFFLYYFRIYIPIRESSLIEMKYRALNRTGVNIANKRKSYELTAQSNADNLALELFQLPQVLPYDKIAGLMDTIERLQKGAGDISYQSRYSRMVDLLHQKKELLLASERTIENKFRAPFQNINYKIDLTANDSGKQHGNTYHQFLNKGFLQRFDQKTPIQNHIAFKKNIESKVYDGTPSAALGSYYSSLQKMYGFETKLFFSDLKYLLDSITFSISIESFLGPIDKSEFDDFFVISCKKKNDALLSEIAYQTFQNEIRISDLDSLISRNIKSSGIDVGSVVINSVSYKVFYSRINFSEDPVKEEDWILCGLIRQENFISETRAVDTIIILYASLILLFVILGMPVIKLLVMSAVERLKKINVWMCGFSIIVGTSLLFLIIIAMRLYWGYSYDQMDVKLKALSDSVHTNFIWEVNRIDSMLREMKNLKDVKANLKLPSQQQMLKTSPLVSELGLYPYFNEMIWIDKDGNQKFSLANHDLSQLSTNLSDREYFKVSKNDRGWDVPSEKSLRLELNRNKFALQSIQSYRNASYEAGISIRSEENDVAVVAMATQLRSVMNPLLPPGYHFTIIDRKGLVWFSSTINKNLQENLLEETQSELLQTAIYGRLSKSMTINYGGHSQRILIRPVNNVPLFLVVHYNLDFYKSPIILILNSVGVFLVWMFLLLGLHLVLFFICFSTYSKLKVQRFYLNWVGPRKDPRFAVRYLAIIITNVITICISFASFFFYPIPAVAFCFVVLPNFLFLYIYIMHECIPEEPNGSWNIGQLLRNQFIIASLIFIILINLLAGQVFPAMNLAVGIQIGYAILLSISIIGHSRIAQIRIKKSFRNNTLYRIFMFTWLVLVSIMPVFFFYKLAHQLEQVNWAKYLQRVAFDRYQVYSSFRIPELTQKVAGYNHYFEKGNYLFTTSDLIRLPRSRNATLNSSLISQDDQRFGEAMMVFKPPFDSISRFSRASLFGNAVDNFWTWRSRRVDGVDEIFYLNRFNIPVFKASIQSLSFFSGFYSLFFWIWMALLLFTIYRILNYSLRSIFGIELLPEWQYIPLTDEYFKLDEWKSKNIFMVGPPYSGKSRLLDKYRQTLISKSIQFQVFDFHQQSIVYQSPHSQRTVAILEHFEFGINDHAANVKKLKLLEQFLSEPNTQVIITSSVNPSWVIDFYEKLLKESDFEKPQDELDYKANIRLWKNTLAGFMTVHQPLSEQAGLVKAIPEEGIRNEISKGNFLPELAHYVSTMSIKSHHDQEDFVLQVEELSVNYYHAIWNTLSRSEKMLLYDLAKDQFVNMKNLATIRLLMKKGLLIVDDRLVIMNKSFNNFILNVVREDEEVAMNQELRKKGTWNVVQIVLILMALGITTFISLAQQDFLHNFNTLVATLGAVIALLLRFGGLFNSSPKTQE